MSIVQHETLILTTSDDMSFQLLDDWITANVPFILHQVVGSIEGIINNKRTIVFGSEGSKQGWATANQAKRWREKVLEYVKTLDYEDGSNPFLYVYFSYGGQGHILIETNTENLIKRNSLRPSIICLCGSTKFKEVFLQLNKTFTLMGNIVLMPGCFGHADKWTPTDTQKEKLDELHKRKIDMADRVVVVNVGGYIGESTRSEIAYTKGLGKQISYYEEF